MSSSQVCIIGLGNRFRQDDAVGLLVVEQLQHLPGIMVLSLGDDPTSILDVCPQCETLILVDAVVTGAPPGTIHRWELHASPPREITARFSTHHLSPLDILQLARTFGPLPDRIVLFGIEVAQTGMGEDLSPPVKHAIPQVVQDIQALVAPQN